ncbi:MAG: Fpg/Nei family DNA glycosylase [Streptosporangiales bacterium]|nr:Fpg/Nei family DNA glycosylase [Streptosporangiales bacterium]
MPELPEVESLATFVAGQATGAVVDNVDVYAFSVLKTYDPQITALTGRALTGTTRWGKFLDLDFGGQGDPLHLVVHLARAGWLRWHDELPKSSPRRGKGPLSLRLRFADGAGFDITEAGTQRKVAAYLVRDPAEVQGVARLGIDPLVPEFTVAALRTLIAGKRTQIKGLLRDQAVIAGIGNAYSDEILHAAKMSPYRVAADLTDDDIELLHDVTVRVLTEAVERSGGLAAGDLKRDKKTNMAVHGRAGENCPVCGDTVREVSFADRSLQYCPTCQTGGKVLADRRLSRLLK